MAEQTLQRVEYCIAPRLVEVESTIAAILDQARLWGLADAQIEGDLHLALDEALANAVFHGVLRIEPEYRRRSTSHLLAEATARAARAPYIDRRVLVLLDLLPDALRITIDDGGPGFDVSRILPEAPPSATSGRGLMLIRSCMDWVQHNACGNQLTMIKRFAFAHPASIHASA